MHTLRAERSLDGSLKSSETYTRVRRVKKKVCAALKDRDKRNTGDAKRLQKPTDELDRQVNRLVTAIRTTDAPNWRNNLRSSEKSATRPKPLARADAVRGKP